MPEGPIELPAWLVTLFYGVLLLVVVTWARIIGRTSQGKPVIARRLRRRVPWGLDGSILAGLVLVSSVLASMVPLETDPAQEKEQLLEVGLQAVGLQAAVLLIYTGIAIGLLLMNYPKLRWADFGFTTNAKRLPRDITFGVMGAAAMLPLVYIVQSLLIRLLGDPTPHPAIEQLMSDPSPEALVAVALLAVVVAPLFEELAFRVLLQGGLERSTSRRAWWPILVSATLFGIAHTNQGFAQAPIIILALGLGYMYRQTHSYVAVVSMHMAFNALSLAVALGAGEALAQSILPS